MNRVKKELATSSLYLNIFGQQTLVVGCGTKNEVSALSSHFPTYFFVGIDLEVQSEIVGYNFKITHGNAECLTFLNEHFDAAYCYHVLEHVSSPREVLKEISRVLKVGSCVFIGTPNKSRLLGYISADESFMVKVWWNFVDWKMRLRGKWSNEDGAHAGFYSEDLYQLLNNTFVDIEDVSLDYYLALYPRHERLILFFHNLRFSKFLFPSNYFIAKKGQN
jgi:SAM-dependent methyltransferase